MKQILQNVIFKVMLISIVLVLVGCATKDEEINQSALYWYEQMILAIADGNLQKADSYFNSLQSEHLASPLIYEALFMLSKAHMDNNENLLAGYFANEYKIRFSNASNVDYMSFLVLLSNYYAFGGYTKDQGFIDNSISDFTHFIALNKNNKYLPYIRHILTIFRLSKLEMNNEIIRVYKMKDKDIAVSHYQQKKMRN